MINGRDESPETKDKDVIAKCRSCSAEGQGKFCSNCGDTLSKAVTQDDVAAGLEELNELFKSTQALGDELEVEFPSETHIGGELSFGEPNESGFVDAAPMVDALMKGHNALADRLYAVGHESRGTRREMGVLAKSVGAVMGHLVEEVRSLSEQVAALGGTRLPRKAAVSLVQKSVGLGPQSQGEDDSMKGDELCKAAVDLEVAGKLQSGDATLVQHYSNRGLTLKSICAADRSLGNRLVTALKPAA